MTPTWMTIADAPGTLKDLASTDPGAAEAAAAKIDQDQMVEKLLAAFVVKEPPQLTLEDLSKQLHGRAA
ncbi:hypothetical protein EV121DRAFT_294348 [Schizophyllum commune]